MDFITITLRNWKKFNGRSDIKNPTWFRLDASLIDDPEFFDFTAEEFKVWIYILCMCCRKNKATIKLFFGHAENSSKLSKKSVLSAVKKLSTLGVLTELPNGSDTGLYGLRTDPCTTDRQTDKQDRQDKTNKHAEPPSAVYDFESVYQKYPRKEGKLPGMRSLAKQIKCQSDFASFEKAVENYCKEKFGVPKQYLQKFSTFVGTERSDHPWREFIEPSAGSGLGPKTSLDDLKLE